MWPAALSPGSALRRIGPADQQNPQARIELHRHVEKDRHGAREDPDVDRRVPVLRLQLMFFARLERLARLSLDLVATLRQASGSSRRPRSRRSARESLAWRAWGESAGDVRPR